MTQALSAQGIVTLDIGPWLTRQAQGLWRIDRRRCSRLAVDQPVQEIEDMGLGRNASLQRHGDRRLYVLGSSLT